MGVMDVRSAMGAMGDVTNGAPGNDINNVVSGETER